ncbi:MAG: hypothetical protein V8T24_09120 [Roseburia hominis]
MEFVQAFLEEPGSCYTKKGDKSVEILFALLQEKMDAFYHTRAKLNQETLEDFLMERDLLEYQTIAREAKKTVANGCLQNTGKVLSGDYKMLLKRMPGTWISRTIMMDMM